MSRFEFLTSDVPFGGANSNIVTGVLSLASSFNPDYGPFHYWVEDKAILVEAFAHFHTRGLDINKFTLYSDKATWERLRAATAPLMPENLTVRSSDQPTTPNRPTVPAPPAPSGPPPPGGAAPSRQPPSSAFRPVGTGTSPMAQSTPAASPEVAGQSRSNSSSNNSSGWSIPQQQQQQQQQTQHQQHQQQQTQHQSNVTTSGIDTAFLLQQLIQQNATTAAAMQSFATSQASIAALQRPKAPTTKFPTWDGKSSTVPLLLARIENYKGDPFFDQVTNWACTVPGTEQQSRRIFTDMFAALPTAECHQFLNNPAYVDNGFGMLYTFIDYLNPSNPEHRLNDIREVSRLDQGAGESTATYLSRVRGFANRLAGVSMDSVMPLFAILGMDHSKYDGLLSRFTSGDASVVTADLPALELLMLGEDRRKEAMGITPVPIPSANRATQGPPNNNNHSDDQGGNPRGPPPLPPPEAIFPPTKGVRWPQIKALFEDKKSCPHCHSRDKFHWTTGCPVLAELNLVCVEDATKAKDILTKYTTHIDSFGGGRGGRGGGRGGRGRGGGRGGPGRGGAGGRGSGSDASSRRATSTERAFPNPPPPVPPTPPPVQPTPASQHSQSTSQYPDTELSSDSDDDADFIQAYGNVIDNTGNSINSFSNLSSTSNPYPRLTARYHLPFGGSGTTNKPKLKWQRKLANRRVRQQHASARRAAASPTSVADLVLPDDSSVSSSVTSSIGSFAASKLNSPEACVFTSLSEEDECCADSGATDFMLPDKAAFTSYRKCFHRFALLGNDTKLPILGQGTAVFSLNGKVIMVRDALHVPGLRAPLYSLRQHKTMPGCGTFSLYNVGSYILFPNFALRIDDSVDNIVSYRSIGRSENSKLDYAQPRANRASSTTPVPSAATPNVIEPDSDDDIDQVTYRIPTPKSTQSLPAPAKPAPPIPPPQPAPDQQLEEDPPESENISEAELLANTSTPLSQTMLNKLHSSPDDIPEVRPCNTPAACENRTTFDTLKLHKIFGCRRFRNQQHLAQSSANAKLISTGELPANLGSFATITNPPAGKPSRRRRKYLDKVHMDIVFGDCLSLGGFRYALILVDVATRYCWIYGLTSLTSNHIISALESFRADANGVPKKFHTDFDTKLIGGQALKWIHLNKSKVIAANAGRQSSNGLAERTWRTLIQMSRAYITEKQVGREFWFYAISHAASMLNQVPGRLGRKLTTPFELVHNRKPDSKSWFELFSVGYFNHSKDNASSRSKMEDHSLDGIAVGRDDKTNTITFYNPITRSYYRPPAFRLDEGRLPITTFPGSIKYDGGLTCGLMRNRSDPIAEPFPPGTRVTIPRDGSPVKGTIQKIPLITSDIISTAANDSTDDSSANKYVILLDDNTTVETSFEDLLKVSSPAADSTDSTSPAPDDPFLGLPHILKNNAKLTMDYQGSFHKGYLMHSPEGGFRFEVRRNPRSRKADWSTPLPSFKQQWPNLLGEDILIPGHSAVYNFLKPSSSNNTPSANFVSAKNLLSPCPPSLKLALHPSNPDKQVWLDSYKEEKGGLQDLEVFERINKKTYLSLRRKGLIPKALPSMCVLCVKHDKDGKPDRAKSRIVVLGNFEERMYSKSDRYAPVLKYSSLRLLTAKAVGDKRVLQQADCKNAFCNADLPEDEKMAIRPPLGDPGHDNDEYWLLKKTLYGLRRSPKHWYNMFTDILKSMNLQPSAHDPCLFSGIINGATATSTNATAASTRQKIYVGAYVDDIVFYSSDPAEEKLFKEALEAKLKVDFMGDADYFLGTAFTWLRHDDGHVSVHLCQSAFTEFASNRFGIDKMNRTPNMTPYRSGLPIDSLPPPRANDPDLKRRTKVYQGIIGSINWLATCTRPDIAPALTFLASYSTNPSDQHYKAAIHALKYLYSTSEYGISFHSNSSNTLQAFNHFPNHHDKEAYSDATPPSPSEIHELTAFCDANWGGQFGNAVEDGTPLELFKYRSLSGFLICRNGGPIAWRAIRQNQTAQSSCEAEVVATNECTTELLHVKLRAQDLDMADSYNRITIYNDNQAAVGWCSSLTNKGMKHINLRECKVREAVIDGDVRVIHIAGVINSSDIFTKELKDAAHFRNCRNSMMVSKSNFLRFHHNVPEHMTSRHNLPYFSIRSPDTPSQKHSSSDVSNTRASAPLADITNFSKAQRSTNTVRRSVHFSESVRVDRYRSTGKQVSRPTFRQLARQGGIDVTRDNCLPRGSLTVDCHHPIGDIGISRSSQ